MQSTRDSAQIGSNMFSAKEDEVLFKAAWFRATEIKLTGKSALLKPNANNKGSRAVVQDTTSEEQISELTGIEIISFSGKFIRAYRGRKFSYNLLELLQALPNIKWLLCNFESKDSKRMIDCFLESLPKHVPVYRTTKEGFGLIRVPTEFPPPQALPVSSMKRKRGNDSVGGENDMPRVRNELVNREEKMSELIIEKLQRKKRAKKNKIDILQRNLEQQKNETDRANEKLAAANQALAELKERMAKDANDEMDFPTFTPATPGYYTGDAPRSPFPVFGDADYNEIIKARKERGEAIKERDEARKEISQLRSKLANQQSALFEKANVISNAPKNMEEALKGAREDAIYWQEKYSKQEAENSKNLMETLRQIREQSVNDPESLKMTLKWVLGCSGEDFFADESLEKRKSEESGQALATATEELVLLQEGVVEVATPQVTPVSPEYGTPVFMDEGKSQHTLFGSGGEKVKVLGNAQQLTEKHKEKRTDLNLQNIMERNKFLEDEYVRLSRVEKNANEFIEQCINDPRVIEQLGTLYRKP